MGKFDQQKIILSATVVNAELQQPLKRSQGEIPASQGLLVSALTRRKPLKDVEKYGPNIVRAQRRVACYTLLVDAIAKIKNGAAMICEAAVRDKNPPADFLGAFQALCCAAEILHHESLVRFRREIACGLYGKATIDRIAKLDQLDEEVRKVLLDVQPSQDDVLQVLTAFCSAHPDLQPQLESTLGITIHTTTEVPTEPSVAPGRATASVSRPAAQQTPIASYQTNNSLVIPLALPPFPRERWQSLEQQVHDAAA
jgi:hypothetical protein